MKILLLTTHLRMGGVPVYVTTLAAKLKRRGNQVCVCSCGGELVKRLNTQGIRHIKLDIDTKSELHPKIPAAVYHLFWVLRENEIEIIHTNTRVAQVIGEALSFLTGVPHVTTCHGFFKPRIGRRLLGCWGRKVIAISEAVREHLVNDFKLKKSRIELIHNGIDLLAFEKVYSQEEKKGIRGELGLSAGPVVAIISRLSSVKGHRFLIKAMAAVLEKHEDAQLLIVGEGEEETALKDLVEELGLFKSVIFIRNVLDTPRILAVTDVFALSSVQEGLGLVILEALCCGKPVVASDVGGVYSVVKDNVTGLLVPARDPAALAGAIIKLIEDKALADRLASSGREFVRENFSLEDMTDKVEALYKEVLR